MIALPEVPALAPVEIPRLDGEGAAVDRVADLAGENEERAMWEAERSFGSKNIWRDLGYNHPTIKQSHLEQMLRDPVLAVFIIFETELDYAQAAMLKIMWWVPRVIDHSGVGGSKTERFFWLANLRAILIPDQLVNVYYQSGDAAEAVFWAKYRGYFDKAPLFREQFPIIRKTYGEMNSGNVKRRITKAGGHIELPAASFATGADNQASRRFNTLLVDEANKIEARSDGVAKELVDRNTRRSWNKGHRLWCNHQVLGGHADDMQTSPMYKRVQDYRRQIAGGSTLHAVITMNFGDYKKLPQLRDEETVKEQKRSLDPMTFCARYGGVWTSLGKDWFNSRRLARLCCPQTRPLHARESGGDGDGWMYGCGWDTGMAEHLRADLSGGIVGRVLPLDGAPPAKVRRLATMYLGGVPFRLELCWGIEFRGKRAGERAEILRAADNRFGFAQIVMDKGGGGLDTYKELREAGADGMPGLATPADQATAFPETRPCVAFFERNPPVADLFDQKYAGDDGLRMAAMLRVRAAVEAKWVRMPPPPSLIGRFFGEVPRPAYMGAVALYKMRRQMGKIMVEIDKASGEPKLTKNGMLKFKARSGKKDLAMSGIYCLMALLIICERYAGEIESGGDEIGYDEG